MAHGLFDGVKDQIAQGWLLGPMVRLSVGEDGKLPTEARLFKAGWNETENGRYLFDELAAELTMEHFARWGVELMIDLEHLSIDPEGVSGDGRNFDPEARGWTKLEVRDGELWISSTRWTSDGARRLKEQTNPYLSPAFDIDDEGRVIAIRNVGMTAMPATHDAYRLVARAKRDRGSKMTKAEFLAKLTKCSQPDRRLLKRMSMLPEGVSKSQALELLAIDMKTLQSVVKAMGGDPGGDITSLFATVRMFADELAAAVTGEPAPEPMMEEGEGLLAANPEEEEKPAAAMARADAEALRKLRERDAAMANEIKQLRTAQDEREHQDKVQRFRAAVAAGHLTPGEVWQDGEAGKLKARLARWSLAEIDEHIKDRGGSPDALALLTVSPTAPGSVAVPAESGPEIGQKEVERLQWAMDAQNRVQRRAGAEELDLKGVLARFKDVKGMQLRGARDHEMTKELGGKLGDDERPLVCLSNGRMTRGQLELLQAKPVTAAEPLGFSSREALREYNTNYMVAVATAPRDWVDDMGAVESSGALEYTYPLDFDAPRWRKRVTQAALGTTPHSADIEVEKEPYRIKKSADWNRLRRGDFAYLNTWLASAAQFGRARVNLRAELIVKILVDNPKWATTRRNPGGLTGENIFSETHAIHPFDDKIKNKATGLTTFSNYSPSGLPLNATNLSLLKDELVLVPWLDGIPFGVTASHILHPTILTRTANDLLTVQDLILAGELVADSGAGVGTMGQVRNPHYNSGLLTIQAPHLPGTAPATADYYLYSAAIAAMGYVPWVVAEDSEELVLDRDIDSDTFKDTGFISAEREMHISAVFLWPHALHKVRAVAP